MSKDSSSSDGASVMLKSGPWSTNISLGSLIVLLLIVVFIWESFGLQLVYLSEARICILVLIFLVNVYMYLNIKAKLYCNLAVVHIVKKKNILLPEGAEVHGVIIDSKTGLVVIVIIPNILSSLLNFRSSYLMKRLNLCHLIWPQSRKNEKQ